MVIRQGETNHYYDIVKFEIDNRNHYLFEIKWKAEFLLGKNGYIVQFVKVLNTITGIGIEDRPYFEAWKVTNGKTKNSDYDDRFECFFIESIGIIKYETEIYWIDHNSELYNIVSEWRSQTVRMAVDLPATYEFPELRGYPPMFRREFIYDNRFL